MKLPSPISWYKNKRIAVIGLSVEGIDTVRFLSAHGAKVACLDRRDKEELGSNYSDLSSIADSFILGESYLDDVSPYDMIVRSPGIALRTVALQEAIKRGQQVTSLTKLFFSHCVAPIIGVTGTKGKGTTSSLIYEMIKRSGRGAWLGGNIGTPLLSSVESIQPNDVVVLELSSFQLEDLGESPRVAVVLKITQEHLANFDPNATNYHESREAYVLAKRAIIEYQTPSDYVVFCADDSTSCQFGEVSKALKKTFSRSQETSDAYVRNMTVYGKEDGVEYEICSLVNSKLRGIHNLENIAAAALASRAIGVDRGSVQRAAIEFKGLEHRLEMVRRVNDVTYINDSFSTVPETAIAAIQSFTEPLILIVGGSEKGSDFKELGVQISHSRVRSILVIGDMTDRILASLNDAGYTGDICTGLSSMKEIVSTAFLKAKKGDVVLLSPACASFDMFKNYKVRGKEFKDEVEKII